MVKKADLGQELLLSENATHSLEIEYNRDMEQVFIQLRDKKTDKCVVLDAESIFTQAYDVLTKTRNDVVTFSQYVIHMKGETFKGTQEDIARWYCKRRYVKLYIEPNTDGEGFMLWAMFPDKLTSEHDNHNCTHIAYFENDCDIESGYRLFFSEYMLECDNPDYELAELS